MNENEFVKSMMYLKNIYTNWNLNISNPDVLEAWFYYFKDIEISSFRKIVLSYCKANRYAPNSPYDLLDLIPKTYDENEAWEKILDVYKRSSNDQVFKATLHKEFPELYDFVSQYDFYNVPKDSFGNDCLGYCIGKNFKEDYKHYKDVNNIKKEQISTSKILKIEG